MIVSSSNEIIVFVEDKKRYKRIAIFWNKNLFTDNKKKFKGCPYLNYLYQYCICNCIKFTFTLLKI